MTATGSASERAVAVMPAPTTERLHDHDDLRAGDLRYLQESPQLAHALRRRTPFGAYRNERQSPETLKAWAAQLGGWDKLINRASTTWRTLPEMRKSPHSDPEWTLLLKEYPALVKRPVVVTGDGVVSVGFTDNGFKQRFGVGK